MDEKKSRKIQNLISGISLFLVAVVALFLFIASKNQKLTGIVFNIIIAVFLSFYWLLLDVVEPILLKQFRDITKKRKAAYIKYIVIDAIGYVGLAVFIFLIGGSSSDKAMAGAVVYVVCISLKRRFKEEFLGKSRLEKKYEKQEQIEGEEKESQKEGAEKERNKKEIGRRDD